MSIDDFYKYIMKKSLLCYDFHESEKSDIPLEEYLLTYNNEWFQVQESAYFYLHILGYKIEYVNKKKIINSCFEGKGNPLLVNSVLLGCEKVDTKIKLKIESYGQVKKVEIKLPQIEDAREKQSYIKNFGKKSIYLYIASFEKFVSSEDIEKCHSNEILYIDLRDCDGGHIVKMLECLKKIIKNPVTLELFDGKGRHNCRIVYPKSSVEGRLSRVNIIVSNRTASAAEIFVMLIKQCYGGMIIGEKTRGKWLIQDYVSVNEKVVIVPKYGVFTDKEEKKGVIHMDKNKRIIPDQPISKKLRKRISEI